MMERFIHRPPSALLFARFAFPKQFLTKGFIKATSEITEVTDGFGSAEAPLDVLQKCIYTILIHITAHAKTSTTASNLHFGYLSSEKLFPL